MRRRELGARVLVVMASVAVLLALVAVYVRIAAVDSDQFANRATAALRDDSVRALIAARITDDVVLKRQSNLLAARPIIQSVTADIVGSQAFTGLFQRGVRDIHRAVFTRDRNTVTLTLADVGTVIAAALEQLRPSLARQVQAADRVELFQRELTGAESRAADVARDLRVLALVLPLLTVVFVGCAIAISPGRRRTIVHLGIGFACAGVLLAVVLGVLRSALVHHFSDPEAGAAAGGVWDAFLGDLRTAAWILAGSGAVIAAAAASLIRPLDVGEPLRHAGAWVSREPSRPALRVLHALVFVALGLLVLIARDAVLQLALTAIGVYLIYEGITALLRMIYRPDPDAELIERPHLRHPRRLAVIAVPAAVIAIAVAAFVGTGGTSTAAPAAGPCNGYDQLCDRPLNRVALAATHNSMSVPLPGWFAAEQDHPIAAQLRAGVRGLLIDTHYADKLPNGRLRTVLGENIAKFKQDGVSQQTVDAALRIRDRLGFEGQGERGMYLCHTFCELGGTPLESVLEDIHTFLVANPGEVLVIINQDYVKPSDFVAAVRQAGLDKLAYRGPVDGAWPTLRSMIDTGQRVVFLAENHAGGAPWYHLAYASAVQETPFHFSRVAQLTKPDNLPESCRPNRGPDDAPLFRINHWNSTDPTPLPSDAQAVNAYDVLLRRVQTCEKLRQHFPNLIAVNFYARGDVFRVVDTLNRVPATR
jgi:hypothetical protein